VLRLFLAATLLLPLLGACSGPAGTRNTNWELLGNSAEMQHHSALSVISDATISRLGLAWAADIPARDGLVGNPLIKDGVVFQSGALGWVFANDLRTGKQLWTYEPKPDFGKVSINGYWAWRYNRGVALWKDLVIVARGDCKLVALDQKSGKTKWESQSCDASQMYGITAAPRVGGDLVFTGNSCADSGMTRGYVDALDARTGQRRWRFYTVPGDPALPAENAVYAMAAKTWGADWYSKTKGCGSAWDAMTYDEKLGLLYIGVGGPGPFNPAMRGTNAGDELFTNSIVAVNAKTGEYVWHFKQVPQDGWNYDSSVGIMIADLPVGGTSTRVVISAPKNGFLYVLDAKTGRFISGNNYAPVNWARGLDKQGRPIPNAAARYWENPTGEAIVTPSQAGAHGWEAFAFSPDDNLLYIPAMIMPTRTRTNPKMMAGGMMMDFYYGSEGDPSWKAYGELVAWDPLTQTARWRHQHALPINGGVMHTSGNLVFEGTADGHLEAYNAKDGERLWSKSVGGAIRGAPSTVMADGEQYLLVATGNGNSSATGTYFSKYASSPEARSTPRLLAFKLDAKASLPSATPLPTVNQPPQPKPAATLVEAGRLRFEQYFCVDCHGLGAETAQGSVPDLRLAPPADLPGFRAIVVAGGLAGAGMPKFGDMTPEDSEAIYAYLINESWTAYEARQSSR
jgi:PQQ-dependent dehydrogenase (methanol/ethanol family)